MSNNAGAFINKKQLICYFEKLVKRMDETYTKLCQIFPVLENVASYVSSPQILNYDAIINELKSLDIFDVIVDQVRLESEKILRHQVTPRFWSNFTSKETSQDFIKFESAVMELYQNYLMLVEVMRRLEAFKAAGGMPKMPQDEKSGFDITFKCTLLSQLPVGFEKLVDTFYGKSFCVFAGLAEEHDEELDESENVCKACEMLASACKCTELVEAFIKTNSRLLEMGILDRIAGFTLTTLIQEQIDKHVKDFCTGRYDDSHIANLENVS